MPHCLRSVSRTTVHASFLLTGYYQRLKLSNDFNFPRLNINILNEILHLIMRTKSMFGMLEVMKVKQLNSR